MRSSLAAVVSLLLALRSSPTTAYQEGGHYYTNYLVLASIPGQPFTTDEMRVVGVCTELPDKTIGLDATSSYTRLMHRPWTYLRWSVGNKTDDPEIRRMITIEQLLHGLTGGDSASLQDVATEVVTELFKNASGSHDATKLCALGFSLHLFGDAFSHRQIDDQKTMYKTGWGHAGDFTFPDLPLFNKGRASLWSGEYVRALSKVLKTPDVSSRLEGQVQASHDPPFIRDGATSCLHNDCNEPLLRDDVLIPDLAALPVVDIASVPRLELKAYDIDSKLSCDDVLARLRSERNEKTENTKMPGMLLPNCEQAWITFRDVSAAAYDNNKKARSDFFGSWAVSDYFHDPVTSAR